MKKQGTWPLGDGIAEVMGEVAGGASVVGVVVLAVVVVVGGIAADGETAGSTWLPNANASMVPALGR